MIRTCGGDPFWSTGFYAAVGAGGGFAFSDVKAAGNGDYDDYAYDAESYEEEYKHFSGIFNCDDDYCSGTTGAASGLSADEGIAGVLGRAEIGADYQMDRFVAGVNASFTLGNRKMSSSAMGLGGGSVDDGEEFDPVFVTSGGGYGAVEFELELGNSWAIGGRLGFLLTDSTLLFASGGYTQAKAKLVASFEGVSGAGSEVDNASIGGRYKISASNDDWLGGYYIGSGVETMLTEQFSLKLDYSYADLGSIKTSADDSFEDCEEVSEACWGNGTGAAAEADVSDHTVMATVGFRF